MASKFVPCDLPRGKDGDPAEYFAKTTGFGYNDMISLPTLTKESLLENLSRRFKVRTRHQPARHAQTDCEHSARAAGLLGP